ncbi:MAG: TPM domain-containing protein, partial [Terracidiphilus sp.]
MKGSPRVFSTLLRLLPAALAACLVLPAAAERLEDLPAPTGYVSDYAHVLSQATVARLERLCTELDRGPANAQIAVVTVRNLDGDDSADYATRLF